MTETSSHAKNRGKKMTPAEKKAAKAAAARRARRQWYLFATALFLIVLIALVLISIYTEGEIPIRGNPNL